MYTICVVKHKKNIFSDDIQLNELLQSHNNHEFEIDPANVELGEILGQGAFGIVRKGLLKPMHKAIAVKMLKGKNGNKFFFKKKNDKRRK